jgi:hypothetical protein
VHLHEFPTYHFRKFGVCQYAQTFILLQSSERISYVRFASAFLYHTVSKPQCSILTVHFLIFFILCLCVFLEAELLLLLGTKSLLGENFCFISLCYACAHSPEPCAHYHCQYSNIILSMTGITHLASTLVLVSMPAITILYTGILMITPILSSTCTCITASQSEFGRYFAATYISFFPQLR